jgi:hypothetical protein
VMGSCLGVMFVGISWLAMQMHVVPNDKETVIAQIARGVLGSGAIGHVLFFVVQASTMLILVLAANTSFADFPRLASFHADDAFMPRQLTKRGHRLVFSNGIVALAIAGALLVVVFQADVTHLIPLYAIGVFTSFTLSQTGMAIHHLRLREDGWRLGLAINGTGAVATGVVTIDIIAITKFVHGAWFVMVLVPILVALLVRLNHAYEHEKEHLEVDLDEAVHAGILRRHSVLLLVDGLDRSTARAIQYARALTPDELKAVHIAIDPLKAERLAGEWSRAVRRVPLELVDCPDRRLARTVLELVAEELGDGETEVTLLVPRREYAHGWHRLLHDRTSGRIARAVAGLPHANVTFVPYHFGAVAHPAEVTT